MYHNRGHQPLWNCELPLVYWLRWKATSLIHTSEIIILLNLLSIISILIFINVKTLIMLMLFLEQACRQRIWSLWATWYLQAPRWWPLYPVAHLAGKKGVCCRRTAFDITFQDKTTLSLTTRNQPTNFAMLRKYYIGKILPIYRTLPIFAHQGSVRKPKLLLRLWLVIDANSLYCSLRCTTWAIFRLHHAFCPPTTSGSAQPGQFLDHSAIVPINQSMM